jgi:hypothetical protein
VLRHRINEKQETNAEDICLLDEAVSYIRDLEGRVALYLDEIHHPKSRKE